jgi:predicted nucleotidyltransferase
MDPLPLLENEYPLLAGRYGVHRIGLFGSFARNEARDDSDLDVLVEFRDGEETFEHYMDLKFHLEDLFGRRVDLVIEASIKPLLRPYILSEAVYVEGPPTVLS